MNRRRLFSVHFSTLLVMMFAASLLIGLNATVVWDYPGPLPYDGPAIFPSRGWPFTYWQSEPWPDGRYPEAFIGLALVIDVVVAVVITILVGAIVEFVARRSSKKPSPDDLAG